VERSVAEVLRDPTRLAAVRRLWPVTGRHRAALDRLAAAAAALLDAPLGLVTLLDETEQHMTATGGSDDRVERGSVVPASRNYCPYTVAAGTALFVDDARREPRFVGLPACVEDGFLGYAGAPLVGPDGQHVGTLCVLDTRPRRWSPEHRRMLEQLALAAGATVGLLVDGRQREALLAAFDDAPVPVAVLRGPAHVLEYTNPECRALLGPAELGVPVRTAYPELAGNGLVEVLDSVFGTGRTHRTRHTRAPAGGPGDGRYFTVSYSQITDEAGRGSGVLAVATDITERVRLLGMWERRAGRERTVARAAEVLTRSADPRAGLGALTASVVPELADACAVYLLEPSLPVGSPAPVHSTRTATALSPAVAAAVPTGAVRWPGGDPVSEAVRTGAVVRTALNPAEPPDWVATAGLAELVRSEKAHAVVTVPVTVGDLVVGVLSFVSFAGRPPQGGDDLAALRRIAGEAGAVLGHDEVHRRTREIALALQRSMLTAVPSAPGLSIGACYRPAGPDAEIGGDWYDAFPTAGGGLGVAVGDVVGHDIAGAAAMGQLRSMLRALAHREDTSPATALDELDRLTVGLRITPFASVVHGLVTLDGGGAQLEWANAGHPPPVLISPEGTARVLGPPPGMALGVGGTGPVVPHGSARQRLAPGSTLLLYTDGLVEQRDTVIDDGIEALVRSAAEHSGTAVQDLCDTLVDRTPADDDVALLAIRVHG
jgi:GAF domain-containing protein